MYPTWKNTEGVHRSSVSLLGKCSNGWHFTQASTWGHSSPRKLLDHPSAQLPSLPHELAPISSGWRGRKGALPAMKPPPPNYPCWGVHGSRAGPIRPEGSIPHPASQLQVQQPQGCHCQDTCMEGGGERREPPCCLCPASPPPSYLCWGLEGSQAPFHPCPLHDSGRDYRTWRGGGEGGMELSPCRSSTAPRQTPAGETKPHPCSGEPLFLPSTQLWAQQALLLSRCLCRGAGGKGASPTMQT